MSRTSSRSTGAGRNPSSSSTCSSQGELEALGIQLKDRRTGLIDFPSEMDGRRVLLCWRLGEESVQYWHDEQSGFAGRQPLSTTLVG